MIIELAQRNNIPLVLTVNPYPVSEEEQMKYNTIADIVAEYNVPFLNYCLNSDEIGLDYGSDFASMGHMNQIGSTKFTRWVADYLKPTYAIPDHRGEAEYSSYDIMVTDYYSNVADAELMTCMDAWDYLDRIKRSELMVIITVNNRFDDSTVRDYFEMKMADNWGIMYDDISPNSVFIIDEDTLINSWHDNDSLSYSKTVCDHYLSISKPEGELAYIEQDANNQKVAEENVNIMIFNKYTGKFVENIDISSEGTIIR